MKKLALIIISINECYPSGGYRGGGHRVTKHLIEKLVSSKQFIIDIYSVKGDKNYQKIEGINSVTVVGEHDFENRLREEILPKKYNYILASDVLLPFANNLVHSNSSRYKSKNHSSLLMQKLALIYNRNKIKYQEKNVPKNRRIFTVSNDLKKDYTENFNLPKENVITTYPAVDFSEKNPDFKKHEKFTLGAIAGGGLNKGGYLLLFALAKLPKNTSLKARIIFPKIHKSKLFKFMVKLLGLSDMVEILPRQSDMKEFYSTIDCYVLPSQNEAFGLVVVEAGALYKPSLMSSTIGARELYSNDINGFIFKRNKDKVANLRDAILHVKELYDSKYEKYIEISKNAKEVSEKLNWDDFADAIINNMVSEC